ncbi:hypothetical protein BOX15_Mlig025247g1 [Macrostomum lignano]|uniref:Uncharacterized protein n=1 Tax=Macrostomum lignano TaxID=282301 RepID=A0A267GBP5_9PLAT|nr:hypothetical protein BOX15_Mlig025247g1 [Macrostomum lignano]
MAYLSIWFRFSFLSISLMLLSTDHVLSRPVPSHDSFERTSETMKTSGALQRTLDDSAINFDAQKKLSPIKKGKLSKVDGTESNKKVENIGMYVHDGTESGRKAANSDGIDTSKKTIDTGKFNGVETGTKSMHSSKSDRTKSSRKATDTGKSDETESGKKTAETGKSDGTEPGKKTTDTESRKSDGTESGRKAPKSDETQPGKKASDTLKTDRTELEKMTDTGKSDGTESGKKMADTGKSDGTESDKKTVYTGKSDGTESGKKTADTRKSDGTESGKKTAYTGKSDGTKSGKKAFDTVVSDNAKYGSYDFHQSVGPIPDSRKIGKSYKGDKPTDAAGSNKIIFIFIVTVFVFGGLYVIYHKKQKIIAYIVEGRRVGGPRSRSGSRRTSASSTGSGYKQVPTDEQVLLPDTKKPESVQNFIY